MRLANEGRLRQQSLFGKINLAIINLEKEKFSSKDLNRKN